MKRSRKCMATARRRKWSKFFALTLKEISLSMPISAIMKGCVKYHFAEKGMALTERELQYLTWGFIQNKLNMGISNIDEENSTEQ